ncbi:MAG: hypothetical protein WKF51_12430, partial [Geodermatophilaceae bacterium]
RWFVYANLRERDGDLVEAWLPVDGSGTQTVSEPHRFTYVVEPKEASSVKWIAGLALYGLVIGFLGAVTLLVRRVGGSDRTEVANPR